CPSSRCPTVLVNLRIMTLCLRDLPSNPKMTTSSHQPTSIVGLRWLVPVIGRCPSFTNH
ncbi:hypothetical protein Ancab_010912, partial [Ancistrocladus abbreviatus]